MESCKECLHVDVCKIRHFPSLFGLTGDGCDHFKNKANLVEVDKVAQKIAEALVKAEIDCTAICKDFGRGCYWKCEKKIEHIKEWIIGVINNEKN